MRVRESREACDDCPVCPAERTPSGVPAAAARPSKPFMYSRRVMDVRLYQLDPGGFAPADPPRLRSRGPKAPLRSGGRACGAPSPLCGSRKRVQNSRFGPHNELSQAVLLFEQKCAHGVERRGGLDAVRTAVRMPSVRDDRHAILLREPDLG